MTNYYKDPISDDEEWRTPMRTPESQTKDTTLYDEHNFNSDYSAILSFAVADESIQTSEDAHEMPFDPTEWYVTDLQSSRKRPPRQYEFLRLLLENPRYSSYVSWLDQRKGLFTILLPDQVVALWKKVKSRQTNGEMDYPIFSRGVRYYYKTGSMIKTNKKYTFCFKQSTDDTGP